METSVVPTSQFRIAEILRPVLKDVISIPPLYISCFESWGPVLKLPQTTIRALNLRGGLMVKTPFPGSTLALGWDSRRAWTKCGLMRTMASLLTNELTSDWIASIQQERVFFTSIKDMVSVTITSLSGYFSWSLNSSILLIISFIAVGFVMTALFRAIHSSQSSGSNGS